MAERDRIEEQLAILWGELLGVAQIDPQESFFVLGGNSMLAVRMFAEVENMFGREPSLEAFLESPTIAQLSRLLTDEGQNRPRNILVPIQPHGNRPPFFCVHGGGGRIVHHYGLAAHLTPDQPLVALQFPTMTSRQLSHLKVEDLAARYIKEMRRHRPDGPYYLGGLCFGGAIAFAMAHMLAEQGEKAALLVLFDTQYFGGASLLTYERFRLRQSLRRHSRRWKRWLGRRHEAGRASKSAFHEKLDDPVEVRHAIIQAVTRYQPGRYPGRVTCFLGGDHYEQGDSSDSRLGWNRVAAGGLEIVNVPGFEFQMFQEPNVAQVAEALRRCLSRAKGQDNSALEEAVSAKSVMKTAG